jgi:hypothetical protein
VRRAEHERNRAADGQGRRALELKEQDKTADTSLLGGKPGGRETPAGPGQFPDARMPLGGCCPLLRLLKRIPDHSYGSTPGRLVLRSGV